MFCREARFREKANKKMTDAGIAQYHPFMPVIFTKLTRKANYRNHRKIVIMAHRLS
jgi:cardiolipin synthase